MLKIKENKMHFFRFWVLLGPPQILWGPLGPSGTLWDPLESPRGGIKVGVQQKSCSE